MIPARSMFSRSLCLAALLAACAGEQPGPTPPVDGAPAFRLLHASAWSGGTLHVVADEAIPATATISVRIGGAVVPHTRLDDSTLAVELPSDHGTRPVTVIYDGEQVAAGSVAIRGLVESFSIATAHAKYIPFVVDGDQYFGTITGDGVSVVDLAAKTVTNTVLPGSRYRISELTATWQPGVFGVRVTSTGTNQGSVETWRLAPTPAFMASYPMSHATSATQLYFATALSPTATLTGANNYVRVRDMSQQLGLDIIVPGAISMLMSPTYDRMLHDSWSGPGGTGMPVFAVPSGQLLYRLPGDIASAPGFSNDGALIAYTAGTHVPNTAWNYNAADQLRVVRTSDGSVLRSGAIPSVDYEVPFANTSTAFDPSNQWIFLAANDRTSHSDDILIYDVATMTRQGRIRVPGIRELLAYPRLVVTPSGALYYYRNGNDNLTFYRIALP